MKPKPITDLERYKCLSSPSYNPLKDAWWAEKQEPQPIIDWHYPPEEKPH